MNPWMMRAPEVEPVSLAEAAAFVGGADGDDAFLLSCLLVSARVLLEDETGCVFVAQKWGMRCAQWPEAGKLTIPHPLAPVIGIDAVRIGEGREKLDLDPAAFAIVEGEGMPTLAARNRLAGEAVAEARDGVVVEVAVGFGSTAATVPAPLRRAVLELAAHWFEHREPISFGRGTLPVSPSVGALIAPYCRGDALALPQRCVS